jgi:hypothetical protein
LFVWTVEAVFVAVFTTVTLAPGTTAPDGSAIVPEIEPVAMPCGSADAASNRQRALKKSANTACFLPDDRSNRSERLKS